MHQIITASLWIISLPKIEVYKWYQNIFTSIKKNKYQPLICCLKEDQYKIYMSGEIYQ